MSILNSIYIKTFSFLHGEYEFKDNKWNKNNRFTKFPPKEGSCIVKIDNRVIYCGDTEKFINDDRYDFIPYIFEEKYYEKYV